MKIHAGPCTHTAHLLAPALTQHAPISHGVLTLRSNPRKTPPAPHVAGTTGAPFTQHPCRSRTGSSSQHPAPRNPPGRNAVIRRGLIASAGATRPTPHGLLFAHASGTPPSALRRRLPPAPATIQARPLPPRFNPNNPPPPPILPKLACVSSSLTALTRPTNANRRNIRPSD